MITTIVTGHVGTARLTKTDAFTVLNFTVASNAVTRSGEAVTNWVNAKIWGPRAEALAPYLVKGRAVAIMGRPEATGYLSEGEAKASLTLHVVDFEFTGPKPEGAPENAVGEEAPHPAPKDA